MPHDQRARRLARLREELLDDDVPVALGGADGEALLEELDYARRPRSHEGVSPRFGALIVPADLDAARLEFPALVEPTDVDIDVVRRLADGRTSFVARGHGRWALVSFDRTIEHEATAVQVARSVGITVVQRQPTGWVRVFAPHGVVTWDGTRWWAKPLAGQLADAVRLAHPSLTSPVLDALAELCVHHLSAGRVGAVLVWRADATAVPPMYLGHTTSVTIPSLDITQRQHFPAILNLLAQTDRAAVVTGDGRLGTVGVSLRWSDDAATGVAPHRGTRHTSARRFSFDEPSTVVFVVSSAGPVSVFRGGEMITATQSIPPSEQG